MIPVTRLLHSHGRRQIVLSQRTSSQYLRTSTKKLNNNNSLSSSPSIRLDKRLYSTTKPCSIMSLLDDDFSIMYAPTDTNLSLQKLESIDSAYELHDMVQEVLEEGNDSSKAYLYLTLKTQANESSHGTKKNDNKSSNNNTIIDKPLYATYVQVIHAICNSNEQPIGSAQRAHSLLQTLKQKVALGEVIYTKGEIVHVEELYHNVMKAWIQSKQKIVPIRLMELFDDMVDDISSSRSSEVFVGIRDKKTYGLILDAWSKSKIQNASFHAMQLLEHMEELSLEQQEHQQIDLSHYKSVMKAIWSDVYKSTLNNPYPPMWIASKSLNILTAMEERYKKSYVDYPPDLECYTLVLQSLAKCVSREYTPMMEFLRQMEHHSSLVLSIDTYEIVLHALAHCTHEDAPSLSNEILEELMQKYTNGDRKFSGLSKEHFRLVLLSHVKNLDKDSGRIAQNVFDMLLQLHDTDEVFEVDADIYTLLLQSYTKHPSLKERQHKANYHLQRIEQHPTIQPTIQTYNAYLHLQSTCISNYTIQNRATLHTCIQTLQRLVGTYSLTPNSATFEYLFQACADLLQTKKERTRVLQELFSLCCQYDAVTDDILSLYKNLISLNVYRSSVNQLFLLEKNNLFQNKSKSDLVSVMNMDGNLGKGMRKRGKVEQRLLRGGRLG